MNKTEEEITVEEFLNLESKRQINRMVRTQSSACSQSERGEGEGREGKRREGEGREGKGKEGEGREGEGRGGGQLEGLGGCAN